MVFISEGHCSAVQRRFEPCLQSVPINSYMALGKRLHLYAHFILSRMDVIPGKRHKGPSTGPGS